MLLCSTMKRPQSSNVNNQNDSMSAHLTTSFMNLWEGNFTDDKALGDWTQLS